MPCAMTKNHICTLFAFFLSFVCWGGRLWNGLCSVLLTYSPLNPPVPPFVLFFWVFFCRLCMTMNVQKKWKLLMQAPPTDPAIRMKAQKYPAANNRRCKKGSQFSHKKIADVNGFVETQRFLRFCTFFFFASNLTNGLAYELYFISHWKFFFSS